MRTIAEGVISRPVTGGAYMPSITPLPDGSYIACQFVSSTFVSSDARIEILRSTDGLATWVNEGPLRGEAAAEDGWSYRGPTITVIPDGRLLMRATRFQADRISETFDARSESLQRPENLVYWSDDLGHTWSAPQLVTVDLATGTRLTAPGLCCSSPVTAGCTRWRRGSPSATRALPTRRPSRSSHPTRAGPGAS